MRGTSMQRMMVTLLSLPVLAGVFDLRTAGQAAVAPTFEAWSRFDFVPGETGVALKDFAADSIGDFPAKWNTNSSGEVVTTANRPGRWLKLTGGSGFVPEFVTTLPEDFTLE